MSRILDENLKKSSYDIFYAPILKCGVILVSACPYVGSFKISSRNFMY